MLRIMKYRIKHNGTYYGPGDTIEGLSKEMEQALIASNPGILDEVYYIGTPPQGEYTPPGDNRTPPEDEKQARASENEDGKLNLSLDPDDVIKGGKKK